MLHAQSAMLPKESLLVHSV